MKMKIKKFEEKLSNGELDDLAEELYEECEKIKINTLEKHMHSNDYNYTEYRPFLNEDIQKISECRITDRTK